MLTSWGQLQSPLVFNGRERERHTDRERERERHTDRERERDLLTESERDMCRYRQRERERHTERALGVCREKRKNFDAWQKNQLLPENGQI
jgi:hypothetical protein